VLFVKGYLQKGGKSMNKFSTKGFNIGKENKEYEEVPESKFIRSRKDNTLMPSMQVKNLLEITTEGCINVIDSDSIAYKTSSSVEEDYIEVTNLKDGSVENFKNITEFKGNLRTEGAIKPDSYLGILNVKREVAGKTPFTLEDFEVTPKKKLKFEKGVTIDGVKFKNSLAVCKYYMDEWINAIKIQTQIPKVLLVLGQGENHRHDLKLPHQYKSSRTGLKPLLLKEAREYLLSEYPSEMAQQREEGVSRGIEADEKVDEYAFKGYLHYRKTGKFSYIKSSIDKDSHNPAGIVFDYTKDFHFAQPQAWLVEHRDVHVGEIELCKNKIKGFSLKHSAMQILLGDKADEYCSRSYLPKELKEGVNYGATAFYKDFANLDNPKDILQLVVDKFYEWFPVGVRYVAWDGTDVNEDTLFWLNQCFLCMYMRLKDNDTTTIVDWLDQYKVDYSKLVGNNKPPTHDLQNEDAIRDVIEEQRLWVRELVKDTSNIKGTKGDLVERLEDTVSRLKILEESLDDFFVIEHNTCK
jgi:hypothetical protein